VLPHPILPGAHERADGGGGGVKLLDLRGRTDRWAGAGARSEHKAGRKQRAADMQRGRGRQYRELAVRQRTLYFSTTSQQRAGVG
jgi:hypothetical protein